MRVDTVLAGLMAAGVGMTVWLGGIEAAIALGPKKKPPVIAVAVDNDANLNPINQVLATTLWEGTYGMAPPSKIDRLLEVRQGDNLMSLLTRAGINRQEAHTAIASLVGLYDPRRDLRVGDEIQLTFSLVGRAAAAVVEEGSAQTAPGDEAGAQFTSLQLPVTFSKDVVVERDGDGSFNAEEIERQLETRWVCKHNSSWHVPTSTSPHSPTPKITRTPPQPISTQPTPGSRNSRYPSGSSGLSNLLVIIT